MTHARRIVVRPLATWSPEQCAGVLHIWREKGWFVCGMSISAAKQAQCTLL
jgi:acetolactate synthase regulatory subunit